jgi:hypothetical protein
LVVLCHCWSSATTRSNNRRASQALAHCPFDRAAHTDRAGRWCWRNRHLNRHVDGPDGHDRRQVAQALPGVSSAPRRPRTYEDDTVAPVIQPDAAGKAHRWQNPVKCPLSGRRQLHLQNYRSPLAEDLLSAALQAVALPLRGSLTAASS